MLKYLVVVTSDNAVSYCHYNSDDKSSRIIDHDTLVKALRWSMQENLNVQWILPDSRLPECYDELLNQVDNTKICSAGSDYVSVADVVVFNDWKKTQEFSFVQNVIYAIHTGLNQLSANIERLRDIISKADRINLIISEDEIKDADSQMKYSALLDRIGDFVRNEFVKHHAVQINLLTDRLMLAEMNNCNAGWESITLAPDGNYYVCPAFYYNDSSSAVGNVAGGLDVKNPQLYQLKYAPLCRECDAWHCKRCVWKNKQHTLEVNTPGHNQCVISHLERNASARLIKKLKDGEQIVMLPVNDLVETEVLDPFDRIAKKFF